MGTAAQILDILRTVIGLAREFVPPDELEAFLSAEAVKRQNLAADLAEAAKFGGG